MSVLKGAAIFGQSGGPTSVINASAAGVFLTALEQDCITKVYGAAHGIRGILEEQFYDMGMEDRYELELLKTTPSSAPGSVRYKLADQDVDDPDYKRLLQVFKKYNIRYFFYNGGNDSMDTCNKVSKFMKKAGYECRCMGVPKTIDNDLYGTDHSPGYGSAAKYVATSTMEVYHDARVYDTGMVAILEVMGRNAGWLTAATALAAYKGQGPDLIYVPELPFDDEKFLAYVKRVYEKNKKVIVAVSEGLRYADGTYVADSGVRDSFGHAQLGGVAYKLADMAKNALGTKVRAIEFSLLQRCAAHWASKTDVEEAFMAGQTAVLKAAEGLTDYCIGFEREAGEAYKCVPKLIKLSDIANTERKLPREWINEEGNFVTKEFVDYALPLIQGESSPPIENGLPRFAKLKKVLATK
ncbi:MAG: 6-phosphofructokinase [Clostridiaceae bacterium]|nr:6-phosphofructokinase [Clostridiaceae bacterium]